MPNFRMRLPKWTTMPKGDYSDNIGGRKSFSKKFLTRGSKFIREWWESLSSLWRPAWFTGWHIGVVACAASVVVVLIINVSLTIYAAVRYGMEGGVGTLYSGSCDRSKTIGLWLHLGINVLSTLLLSGSNYTQQCLAAPTRSEIDAAHARKRWMDIGVPSVRNLFRIKPERTWLWTVIGITSIPLHLLYNSAVYTTIAANSFVVATVTNNHFGQESLNMTERLSSLYQELKTTDRTEAGYIEAKFELFTSVFERYNTRNHSHEYLTPLECTKLYNTDFLSGRGTLFLITKHSSAVTHNNTLLDIIEVPGYETVPNGWMCTRHPYASRVWEATLPCNASDIVLNVTRGLPWRMELRTYEEVEISGCRSERVEEKCKVQFSIGIMIVVICCNLLKACGMVMTVVRSREPTLVTLGDAMDSFLRTPDSTTIGICFADRWFVQREWRCGRRTGPKQWNQKEVKRWWTSVSKTRWITCNFFCSITIILAGVLLRMGMVKDGSDGSTDIKSMWTRGFGKVNSVSLVSLIFGNITQAILLANLPQTILSFLYLTYNSLFTCMLTGYEWSLFGHHHRTLRVTSPQPGQRSTYWLQIPYIYAIPLMTMSSLLHWLTSQSIFLAKVEVLDPLGGETSAGISSVGYSCIAIIFVLPLGILAMLTAAGVGYKQFAAEITTVGSCSAAISAACHAWGEDSEGIVGKKLRWGDVGNAPDQGVRHLTFSNEERVGKPVFGAAYAGRGRERD